METEQPLHEPHHHGHPGSPPKRPKGILKNRSTSNSVPTIPNTSASTAQPPLPLSPELQERPDVSRGLSEREIVLQNTLRNQGDAARRRSSSRGMSNASRRQSGSIQDGNGGSPRLKWDEVNLYLTEQEREAAGARMKIDEPKTPFAGHYDPDQDQEMAEASIDPGELVVDEVEKKHMQENGNGEASTATPKTWKREVDIPGLDLGEPEMDVEPAPRTPESERRVMVDENMADDVAPDHVVRHGEAAGNVTEEEAAKHRKFEEARKRHYEMSNVKNLLGHPEDLDEEDDEANDRTVPAIPTANGR